MIENNIINTKNQTLIVRSTHIGYSDFNFYIQVKSKGFAGETEFCILKDNLILSIKELSKMYDDLQGFCVIGDYDSDGYIKLEMQKRGHLKICGEIGGSHRDHMMKFSYITDQTILPNLIKVLSENI